jgi:hypothetical protein
MGNPYGQPPQNPYGQPPQQPASGQPPQPGHRAPGQNPRQITVNGHGIFGLIAIALMVAVAFILHWNIIWWYFVLAILAYSTAIISLTYFEESTSDDWERFQAFRWLLGCHIAFLFLAGGFWLNFGNFFVQVGIFLAAVAAGLAIPFLLLRKK